MEQYIDKSVLVVEIDNRIKKYTLLQQKPEMSDLQEELQNKIDCLNSIQGYILNTLEVKEVDLEKEIDSIWNPRFNLGWDEKSLLSMNHEGFTTTAKHFFELGMAASIKAQKQEMKHLKTKLIELRTKRNRFKAIVWISFFSFSMLIWFAIIYLLILCFK